MRDNKQASMSLDGPIAEEPHVEEVRRQLHRMLSSPAFRTRTKLSRFLRHVVSETIEAKVTHDESNLREHSIGFALFENYDPNGSAVRTNATLLRDQIRKYYSEWGSDDLINISIPAPGYKAVFIYNRSSPAEKHYRSGCLRTVDYQPEQTYHSSVLEFRLAVQKDRSHAPAPAAIGEGELWQALYWRSATNAHHTLNGVKTAALEAVRLQPELWLAHLGL